MTDSQLHIFGIRHHGPGSARSLRAAFGALRPDCVLVEGPPDADHVLPLALHAEMAPPVALLVYVPSEPKRAVYYPFACFSPEWQAIRYALQNGIELRFIDLPQAVQLAMAGDREPAGHPDLTSKSEAPPDEPEQLLSDPLSWVARSVGYSDGERWWEHLVEQRRDSRHLFAGILELMAALRSAATADAVPPRLLEGPREAYMRTEIRSARQEGWQKIAVVCGAWHAPALAQPDDFTGDEEILQGLPRVETSATWVPWTYDRLTLRSGYGAGIQSPGWYEHIWQQDGPLVEGWLVHVARLFRDEDLMISPAHVIEAIRLAESLAALREHPLPGLPEITEAIQAVFCGGDETPLRLIHERLIVGQRLGEVPAETPAVPLQKDLAAAQKRTRLHPSASPEILDLDLRKPLLLERSYLLHRLNVLGIPWGQLQAARGAKGTFHEIWRLAWQPEFSVAIIEASLWGNTLVEAATRKIQDLGRENQDLPALTRLIEAALLADLPDAISGLIDRVQHESAASGNIMHLMDALPPLANVLRYGDVRQTGAGLVSPVVDEVVVRICIGLPPACQALDDDAAQAMFERIGSVSNAISLLENPSHAQAWTRTLSVLAVQDGVHGILQGRACRLLFDRSDSQVDTAQTMSLALSPGQAPAQAAAWAQGFLHGSGAALIHNPRLWQIVDRWVLSLTSDTFNSLLPLLRRTFSAYPAPERRQIGELARSGGVTSKQAAGRPMDEARATKVLPLLAKIFGLEVAGNGK